jgi:hypothetical protein
MRVNAGGRTGPIENRGSEKTSDMPKESQLTRGLKQRLMYVENKDGDIDGAHARVGRVSFSKTGKTVYYRGRKLAKANGVRGNFLDVVTRHEYWVSGIKRRGGNAHPAEIGVSVLIDADAKDEYQRQKSS